MTTVMNIEVDNIKFNGEMTGEMKCSQNFMNLLFDDGTCCNIQKVLNKWRISLVKKGNCFDKIDESNNDSDKLYFKSGVNNYQIIYTLNIEP